MDDSPFELDLALHWGDIIEFLEPEFCSYSWRRRDEAPSEVAFFSLRANGELNRDFEWSELLDVRFWSYWNDFLEEDKDSVWFSMKEVSESVGIEGKTLTGEKCVFWHLQTWKFKAKIYVWWLSLRKLKRWVLFILNFLFCFIEKDCVVFEMEIMLSLPSPQRICDDKRAIRQSMILIKLQNIIFTCDAH